MTIKIKLKTIVIAGGRIYKRQVAPGRKNNLHCENDKCEIVIRNKLSKFD